MKYHILLTLLISCTSFAHEKHLNKFRNYTDSAPEHVKRFYRLNHTHQTLSFAVQKKNEYGLLNKAHMSVWQAFEMLEQIVDESDSDNDLPQIHHAFQTAEAIRKDGQPRWMILTGFLHDLGKILTTFGEPQWAVVGDTFPVGCAYSDKVVFHEYFVHNPDYTSKLYRSRYGIYRPHCGFNNLHMAWGHDEYLYQVMKEYLPKEALYIIRFHSFYAAHKEGAYKHLMNAYDKKMLPLLQQFSAYDLYSKDSKPVNVDKLMPYYQELVTEFLPDQLKW